MELRFNGILFFLFLAIFSFSEPLARASGPNSFNQIEILVGETKEIGLEDPIEINLSRKGIVHLVNSKNKWQITGLKPGFLLITATEKSRKTHIKVRVKSKRFSKSGSPNLIPEWICRDQDISCLSGKTLSGNLSSFLKFSRFRAICNESPGCFFGLTLSEPSFAKWESTLAKRLKPYFELFPVDGSRFLIGFNCDRYIEKERGKFVDFLLEGVATNLDYKLVCTDKLDQNNLRVFAQIFMIKKNIASETGLDFNQNIIGTPKGLATDWTSKLLDLEQKNKITVIGKPYLEVFPGQEAMISSGGEHFVFSESSQHSSNYSAWKKYGIQLRIKAVPTGAETWIEYELKLLAPDSSRRQSSHSSNKISSTSVLKNGNMTILGGLNLNSYSSESKSNPLFERIPIIGPIFQKHGFSRNDSILFAALKVERQFNW